MYTLRRNAVVVLCLFSAFVMVPNAARAQAAPAPTYVPLFVDSIDGAAPKAAVWYDGRAQRSVRDQARAKSGNSSVKVSFADERNFFGGRSNIGVIIPSSETIWYRIYMYIPETASFSSTGERDYSGWGKFMVLAQPASEGTIRMYLQLRAPVKKNFGDTGFAGSGLRIDSDGGMGTCNFQADPLPRNRWFSLQYAWKLGSNGWARAWVDSEFVGECPTRTPPGYTVGEWGIGDYWNGGAWIKASSTASFWIDDVVISTETPNTQDAGGRPFIHPEHFTEPVERPGVFPLQ